MPGRDHQDLSPISDTAPTTARDDSALRRQLLAAQATIEALRSRPQYTTNFPDIGCSLERSTGDPTGHCSDVPDFRMGGGPSLPSQSEIVALTRDYLWHDRHTSVDYFSHRVLSLRMNSNRLLIELEINGIRARVLLDTGATLSCVSGEFAAKHPASIGSQTVLCTTVTPIEVADSRSVRCLSTLSAPVLAVPDGGSCVPVALHVMPLPNKIDAILGVDWLRANHVTLDFNQSDVAQVSFGASTEAALSAVAASRRLTAPAISVSYCGPTGPADPDEGYDSEGDYVEVFDHKDISRVVGSADPVLCFVSSKAPPDPGDPTVPHQRRVDALQSEFAQAFSDPKGVPTRSFHMEMDIPLLPGAKLPPPRAFEVPHRQRRVLTDWLDKCVRNGWVREQMSPVNSPVFCVPKANGAWRVVCDFRGPNSVSKNFYQSNIESTTRLVERLAEAKILSNCDAADGFYQLPLRPDCQYLTAFTVDRKQYVFLVAPQGLKNTPLKFQELVNTVLRRSGLLGDVQLRTLLPFMEPHVAARYDGWDPGSIVGVSWGYIDDIVVGSLVDDMDLHQAHLKALLAACIEDEIHLKFSKCAFFRREISFLGQIVGNGVARIDPLKISAVMGWARPTCVREVQGFLGFVNYFRRHINGISETAAPLYQLTRKRATWVWGPTHQLAYDRLRDAVTSAPVLQLPRWDRPFVVVTDSSTVAAGAALMQEHDGCLLPVAYFSETLKGAELNYPVRDLEALALKKAVVHFRFYLWGAPFQVRCLTDHRSLQHLRTQRDLHGRLGRWQDALSEFDYTISFFPGRQNVVADYLSRQPAAAAAGGHTQVRAVIDYLAGLPSAACDIDTVASIRSVPALLAPVLTRLQVQRELVRDLLSDRAELFAPPASGDSSPPSAASHEAPSAPAASPRADPTVLDPDDPYRDLPVPLVGDDLSYMHSLDYSADREFGPLVELFRLVAADATLRRTHREHPSQLDPKSFELRLRKFLPKLRWYQLVSDRLYNLSEDSIALVVPDVATPVDGVLVSLRTQLISHFHDSRLSAHRGAKPTYLRLRRHFYWHRMSSSVHDFVQTCDDCRRAKSRTTTPYGLIEAPGLPSGPAQAYTMDFIFDLAADPVTGYDGIMVVIDRFSDITRLLALHSTCTALAVAELLEVEIFLRRGYPWEIICDRDPRFMSKAFTDFARTRGFRLSASSGDHAETDGKSERRFRTVEEMVRCFINHEQNNVFQMLPQLEFACNDAVDPPRRTSAFLRDKGYNPMRPIDVATVPFRPAATSSGQDHWDSLQSSWSVARDAVRQAQSQYVYQANKHRRAIPLTLFAVGSLVYVSRNNFVPPAMRDQPTRKFQPRFFGPYRVLRRVSSTSYRVELPANVRTHPVFHASRMKPFVPSAKFPGRRAQRLDPVVIDGSPEYRVDQLLKKRKHYSSFQYLVKWTGHPISEASWESATKMRNDIPELVAEFERDHVSGGVSLLQHQHWTDGIMLPHRHSADGIQ